MNGWPFNKLGRQAFVIASLTPLICSRLLSIWIGFQYSMDVQGKWPLGLGVGLLFDFFYVGITANLANVMRVHNISLALRHHFLLAAALAAHASLYYMMKIDWLAINTGKATMTIAQRIVYSHWTPWAIYVLFFGVWVVVLIKRRGADSSAHPR
jgi:hypothetical protein